MVIAGFTAFTWTHVVVSLLGIATGLLVVSGMTRNNVKEGWSLIFLVATTATSATGFFFPFFGVLPSHIIGVVSLVVVALVIVARYFRLLQGAWRTVFSAGVVIALYLNIFVFVVQLFRRVPALTQLAPTQSEPPFALAQGLVLVLFVWLGIRAVKGFRAAAAPA